MKKQLTKQALLDGEIFRLSNEEYQISVKGDDIRIATVKFEFNNKNHWANGFNIEFNGVFVHSSKTFPAMMKRLQKLTEKWNLTPTEE